jgi:hypothetical protein
MDQSPKGITARGFVVGKNTRGTFAKEIIVSNMLTAGGAREEGVYICDSDFVALSDGLARCEVGCEAGRVEIVYRIWSAARDD